MAKFYKKDSNNRWERFDPLSNQEIEQHFQSNSVMAFKPTKGFFKSRGDYLIELFPSPNQPGIFHQRNLKTGRRRKIKREILHRHKNSSGILQKETFLEWIYSHWDFCDYSANKMVAIETDVKSLEYQCVFKLFKGVKFYYFLIL